jgi:hypothetical protein
LLSSGDCSQLGTETFDLLFEVGLGPLGSALNETSKARSR